MEGAIIKLQDNFKDKGKLEVSLCNSLGIRYNFNDYDSIVEILEKTLPQILRRSFVISVWSFFEKNANKIADIQSQSNSFKISEIRGSILDRIKLYFDRVHGIKVCEKNDIWDFITKFKKIRDIIAHSNGYISMMSPTNHVVKYITENNQYLEIDDNYIVIKELTSIEKSYLVQCILRISSFLHFLLDRINAKG